MAIVNHAKKEINIKIVYTGVPGNNAADSIDMIFNRLKPEFRGQTRSMPMNGSQLKFCDFQPPGQSELPGFSLRFHLYTLAGEIPDPSAWRMVLKGADGVVFTTETDPDNPEAERTALAGIIADLNGLGFDLSQLPLLVQAERRQGEKPVSADALQRMLAAPGLTVVLTNGDSGVLEALAAIVRKITAHLKRQDFSAPTELPLPDQPETDDELLVHSIRCLPKKSPTDNGQSLECVTTDPGTLKPDGIPVEIPLRICANGTEAVYTLTMSLRLERESEASPQLGSGYVR